MRNDFMIIWLILTGSIVLGFGSFKMKIADPVSVISVFVGAVLVYGSAKVLKLLKKEVNEKNILIVKFAGLLVVCIGIFKVFR